MPNEHVNSLRAAREKLIEQRRKLVQALAKPYERGKTEKWREDFVTVQQAIVAMDEAIEDERKLDPDPAGVIG